jgi:hypothetical protein
VNFRDTVRDAFGRNLAKVYKPRVKATPPPSKHRKRLRDGSGTALATGRRPAAVKAERRARRKMRTATRRSQRAHGR